MRDGGTWWKAKIRPCKHAIVTYDVAMLGYPSQNAYGDWQKISHAIPPWQPHGRNLKTLFQPALQ